MFRFLLLTTVLFFGSSAFAAPACTTNSYAFYTAAGDVCSIGLLNFDFTPTGLGHYQFQADDNNPPASSVTVTPVVNGVVYNGVSPVSAGDQIGFIFSDTGYVTANNNPFGASPTCCATGSQANPSGTGWVATNPDLSGAQFADLNLQFTVSIVNPKNAQNVYSLTSTSTTLNVFILNPDNGGTFISMGESIQDSTSNATLASLVLNAFANTSGASIAGGGTALSRTANFNATSVLTNKDIAIDPGLDSTQNAAALNSVTETFTYGAAAPEPGSFVLVIAGAVLFGAYRWRKLAGGIFTVIALLASAAPGARAVTLCSDPSLKTMANFEALGAAGCWIGNDFFNNFTFSVDFTQGSAQAPKTTPKPPNPAFTVSAFSNQGAVGFEFQPTIVVSGFTANTPGVASFTTSFNVTIGEKLQSPGFSTADSTSIAGSGNFNTTVHSGSNTYAASNTTVKQGSSTLGTITYAANGQPVADNCCSALSSGMTLLITNQFTLDAPAGATNGAGSGNNAHISNYTDTLLVTPEPLETMLIGSGLVALAMWGRKNFAKRL